MYPRLKNNPTRLKKMHLNSVDFVRRGANPEAHIAIKKSFEGEYEEMDVAKAEQDLTLFTSVLGESFSSIMKDDSLDDGAKAEMLRKSLSEFNDTVGGYVSSLGILENPATTVTKKSSETRKGDDVTMANFENIDKSRLEPWEAAVLDAIVAKASTGHVNPAAAQEEVEDGEETHPAVKKALEEVENLKKSLEMKELENVAKKYEVLGKKADEEAKVLYDLRKSGEANYNAYIAALDGQVELINKSGIFTEIGKSGGFQYSSVSKSEPEAKVETIAKSYMEKDPDMDYATALAKAWENNPDLIAAYEESLR